MALVPRLWPTTLPLPGGCTAYWPLDSAHCEFGSGQIRPLDIVGNNYGVDAKSPGAVGGPPADSDSAAYFRTNATTNTYLQLNADPLAATGGVASAATVAVWVNFNSYGTNEAAGSAARLFAFHNALVIAVEDGSSALGPGGANGPAGSIYSEVPVGGSGVSIMTTASVAPLGTWTHIAVTFVSQAPTAIYINGVKASTGTAGVGLSTPAANFIGSRDTAARISDARYAHAMVWGQTVLTDGEIASLYASDFFPIEEMPALMIVGDYDPGNPLMPQIFI